MKCLVNLLIVFLYLNLQIHRGCVVRIESEELVHVVHIINLGLFSHPVDCTFEVLHEVVLLFFHLQLLL